MILGMPPVRTIPLAIKLRLESADLNGELASISKDINPLAEVKRTETLVIPLRGGNAESAPVRLRLHAQLTMANGVVFDETWPVEFQPDELEVADE
jgi:hypothetical protein